MPSSALPALSFYMCTSTRWCAGPTPRLSAFRNRKSECLNAVAGVGKPTAGRRCIASRARHRGVSLHRSLNNKRVLRAAISDTQRLAAVFRCECCPRLTTGDRCSISISLRSHRRARVPTRSRSTSTISISLRSHSNERSTALMLGSGGGWGTVCAKAARTVSHLEACRDLEAWGTRCPWCPTQLSTTRPSQLQAPLHHRCAQAVRQLHAHRDASAGAGRAPRHPPPLRLCKLPVPRAAVCGGEIRPELPGPERVLASSNSSAGVSSAGARQYTLAASSGRLFLCGARCGDACPAMIRATIRFRTQMQSISWRG